MGSKASQPQSFVTNSAGQQLEVPVLIESVTSRHVPTKFPSTQIDIRDPGMIYWARLTLGKLDTHWQQ